MDMLAAMRVFQRVATTLSFTEAGDLLGLAPSSVSRQIDAIEAHLGVKLLTRSTRRLSLTEPGLSYKDRVDALLAGIDALHEHIAAYGDEPLGTLKVSSPRVFGKRLLTPLIPAFLKAYPKVTLELSLTDDYVDLVETDTDIAIRIGALAESALVSRPLGRYRRIVCCHPDYLLCHPYPQTPADLLQHNCLRYRRSGERVVWSFAAPDGGEALELCPQGDLIANDIDVLHGATLAGAGIGLLPHWLIQDELQRGELVALLGDYPLASNLQETGIHFVYAINRRQSKKVHAWMDFVLARLGSRLA